MLRNEICKNKVYRANVQIELNEGGRLEEISLLIRVVGFCSGGKVEVVFLNDIGNTVYYVEPSRIQPV